MARLDARPVEAEYSSSNNDSFLEISSCGIGGRSSVSSQEPSEFMPSIQMIEWLSFGKIEDIAHKDDDIAS